MGNSMMLSTDGEDRTEKESKEQEDWQMCDGETSGKTGHHLDNKLKYLKITMSEEAIKYDIENKKLRVEIFRTKNKLLDKIRNAEGVYKHLAEKGLIDEWLSTNDVSSRVTREFEIYKKIYVFVKEDLKRNKANFAYLTKGCERILKTYNFNFSSNDKLRECLEWLDLIESVMSFYINSLSLYAETKGLELTHPEKTNQYDRYTWKKGNDQSTCTDC